MTARTQPFTTRFASATYFVLIGVAVALAATIAARSTYNAHPDEVVHVDAFCFYESHWWPPPLNAGGLIYGPDGWSHVYNDEVVYVVYGQIAHALHRLDGYRAALARPATMKPAAAGPAWQAFLPVVAAHQACALYYRTYRLLNVGLYALTLRVLYRRRKQFAWIGVLGLLLIAIPQVLYIYSYANSDAWGLSTGIFLVLYALAHVDAPRWSWPDAAAFGALTGVVLLAKTPYRLLIPLALLIVAYTIVQRRRATNGPSLRHVLALGVLAGVIALAISAPLKFVYPLSQGDYAGKVLEMREMRWRGDMDPHDPMNPGYLLASRGVPIWQVPANNYWRVMSVKSFYGVFGYMIYMCPNWIYAAAGSLLLAGIVATLAMLWKRWVVIAPLTKLLFFAAPFLILASAAASLYFSWTYDMQPQGRYLFPALIPLALLLGGVIEVEPRRLVAWRVVSWALLVALSLYVIWALIVAAPWSGVL